MGVTNCLDVRAGLTVANRLVPSARPGRRWPFGGANNAVQNRRGALRIARYKNITPGQRGVPLFQRDKLRPVSAHPVA